MSRLHPIPAAATLGVCLLPAVAPAQILSSFDPAGNGPVAIAYGSDTVYVYDDFSGVINAYDRAGAFLRDLPRPGNSSNDFDLDVLDAAATIGGTAVPAGALLVGNGDDNPTTLYALDAITGDVLASQSLGRFASVGVTYNPADGRLYSLDWSADLVRVFDPNGGALLDSFAASPAGAPPLDIFFGDLDLDADGNLQLVTDQNLSGGAEASRVLTTTGAFVADFNLGLLAAGTAGDLNLAGIAFDNARGEAWVVSRGTGLAYQLGGFPVPEPATAGLLAAGALALIRRRR